MTFYKKLTNFLILLLISTSLIGCASAQSSKDTDTSKADNPSSPVPTYTMVNYMPDSDHVRLLGRSIYQNGMVFMGYSSTGLEFNVSAKKLSVNMLGDSGARGSDTGSAARIVAFVNGERKLDEMLVKSMQEFVIFEGEELVEGIVQILKVSECSSSLAGIESISTNEGGLISPTEARELKIEFIGDSITCGYGVDDLVKEHHFRTSTEDNTKTYAYKTAKALNADYSMVSISGWGIISGYSGDGTKQSNSALPKVYDKLGFTWGASLGRIRPSFLDWDFSIFQPDFVVINLGTNDASYTKNKEDRIKEYSDAYVEFLKDVRAKNPKAYIICSLGIMGQDLCPAIDTAVLEYKNQSGDQRVESLKFNNQSMADGIAADWHPSEKTHTKAAAKLTEKIKEIIDLKK